MIVNQTPYPLSFSQEKGQTLIARYGEEGRQYVMQPDVDVSGLVASLQIVKPDNTFVIASADIVEPEEGPSYIVCTIPLQATAIKGIGHYSLYIQDDSDMIIYSAEGQIWVDDHLITDEMIESVAEVYGLRFPQDFLTVENLVDIVAYVSANLINDNTTAEDTTWSSQKIDEEISHIEPEPVTATEQGNPLTITDAAETTLVECVATVEAVQDLHGYSKPWVGGAGKNKFDENIQLGFYAGSNGNYVSSTTEMCSVNKIPVLPNTQYYLKIPSTNASLRYYASDESYIGQGSGINAVFTTPADCYYININFGTNYGTIYNYDVCFNVSDPSFNGQYSPYSNICPISGLSSIDVNIAASSIDTPKTFYSDLGETIYGGSADLIHGEKTKTWGYIASYNGESLPGVWMSDRDGYEPGTNPTTGAEVAYELAGPLSSSISPLVIKTLLGNNYITTNAKTLSLEYITQFWDPLVYHGKIYSTNEQIIGKWIDEKTVYEKTLTLAWAAATETSIPHGITDFGELIDVSGKLVYNSQYIPIPYVSTNVLYNIGVGNANATKIDIGVGGGFSGGVSDIALTMRYTKSS